MSQIEDLLDLMIRDEGLPEPVRELRFAREIVGGHKGIRKRLADLELKDWRFDFAWPNLMLACEVEGGGWVGGRHTTGKGFEGDLRKYDAAMKYGWTVYRCSGAMVKEGVAIQTLKGLLYAKAELREDQSTGIRMGEVAENRRFT